MTEFKNDLGQPIGFPMPDWQPCDPPPRSIMTGQFCRVEPLDVGKHATDLFEANRLDRENRIWTYLPYGPFDDLATYQAWMEKTCQKADPLFHAIIDARTDKAVGVASYLRIEPSVGCIEVGHINYSPALQRTWTGTEAMFLMMKRVFDELGYRRYEWKCDNLNAGSKAAAVRYGFTFEGIFRQATLYNGRNRDTSWFAIIDQDWPAVKAAFEAWLAPDNRNPDDSQKAPLGQFMSSSATQENS